MNDYRESFIELASPTFSPTQDDSRSPYSALASLRDDHPPPPRASVYADDEFSSHPYASTKPLLAPLSTAGKPPIPTSAKPDFSRRSRSAQRPAIEQPSPNTPSPSDSSPDYERALRNRPSTSNLLQPHERADLVRKTRKLTQLFGQTPGVGHYPVDVDLGRAHVSRTNLVGAPPHPSRRKHRPAASMLDDPIVPVYDAQRRVVWPPADDAQYASAGARRRSVPLSPAEFWTVSALSVSGGSRTSSLSITSQDAAHVIEIGSAEGTAQTEDGDSHTDLPDREASPRSPESFIDLSDEEDPAAFPDCRSPATPKGYPLSPLAGPLLSPSTPSIDGLSLSAEQLAEEDRRRKRERLAKLHRFLGSRVPAHLVLGPLDEGLPLPLPASPSPQDDMCGEDADARKLRLRRRRSSSAAEFAGTWSDEIDRLKEDLNDREKAINVRRAVKMEKMFGVAPPQVLYHTRQAVSSPGSSSASPATPKSKHSPQSSAALPPQQSAGPSAGRNPNQAAYKGKSKKGARPGTAESTEPLIDPRAPSSDNWDGGGGNGSGHMLTAMSDVYLHYRHSLNSLNDIIDRDDKQSLAELHDYLSGRGYDTGDETPTEESVFPLSHARAAAQTKAERRRSMPTRTSMASVSSEWTVLPSPPPEENAFQQRRRRAAKLTQFFGVNYRDLMNEILESIEKGLEEERGRGTMQPDEIQDLMQKLRRLKTKRNNWP
ncbi:hypothetical protein FOMPIDRAFT_1028747 [Fomitopsis schrenkii]|uniref:Uncharacterized protein n=1 Tax=Fomitopsis schrenkii TaxID=2126942 RepID=S8EEN7_FOMSC|nr:hypothetical protein FOMPIDRAFT_1028747 [Fomitopsis schrenkii]